MQKKIGGEGELGPPFWEDSCAEGVGHYCWTPLYRWIRRW